MRTRTRVTCLSAVAWVAAATPASAITQRAPQATLLQRLTESEVQELETSGVLRIESSRLSQDGKPWRQCFEAFRPALRWGALITTDAPLAAFSVLAAEAIREVEELDGPKVDRFLEELRASVGEGAVLGALAKLSRVMTRVPEQSDSWRSDLDGILTWVRKSQSLGFRITGSRLRSVLTNRTDVIRAAMSRIGFDDTRAGLALSGAWDHAKTRPATRNALRDLDHHWSRLLGPGAERGSWPPIPRRHSVLGAILDEHPTNAAGCSGRLVLEYLLAEDRRPPLHGIYAQWMNALASLARSDARAPQVFRSVGWRKKELETLLAGWALSECAVKRRVERGAVICRNNARPYMVSPYPEFFASLAELCRDLAAWRSSLATPSSVDTQRELGRIGSSALHWLQSRRRRDLEDPADSYECYLRIVNAIWPPGTNTRPRYSAERKEVERRIRQVLQPSFDASRAEPWVHVALSGTTVTELVRLESICRSLATLADKQLDGVEWTEQDQRWLTGFGDSLALIYGFDSALRDPGTDMRRLTAIAEVQGLADSEPSGFFHAGTKDLGAVLVLTNSGAARNLWVGPCLTYAEGYHERVVSGEEWRRRLDGDQDDLGFKSAREVLEGRQNR